MVRRKCENKKSKIILPNPILETGKNEHILRGARVIDYLYSLSRSDSGKEIDRRSNLVYPVSSRMKEAFDYGYESRDFTCTFPYEILPDPVTYQKVVNPNKKFNGLDPFNDKIFFVVFEDGLRVNSELVCGPTWELPYNYHTPTDISALELRMVAESYIISRSSDDADNLIKSFNNVLTRIMEEGPKYIPVWIQGVDLGPDICVSPRISLGRYVKLLKQGIINGETLNNRDILGGTIDGLVPKIRQAESIGPFGVETYQYHTGDYFKKTTTFRCRCASSFVRTYGLPSGGSFI